MDILKHSPLGSATEYPSHYSPKWLFPVERIDKQRALGLDPDRLPFVGSDLWYGYELSWLNSQGKPVIMVGRFELPCNSPALIESKSFKLYLNSFNQTVFASTDAVLATMEEDLGRVAGAPVKVELLTLTELENEGFSPAPGFCVDDLEIDIDCYSYNPDLLRSDESEVTETLHSHLLKSNCPVTGQPDWGTVVIDYCGEAIDHTSLLRYICSFRDHQEFHEQCVERIFVDLQTRFRLSSLCVYARYLRRGGLDINPWRSSGQHSFRPARFVRQ